MILFFGGGSDLNFKQGVRWVLEGVLEKTRVAFFWKTETERRYSGETDRKWRRKFGGPYLDRKPAKLSKSTGRSTSGTRRSSYDTCRMTRVVPVFFLYFFNRFAYAVQSTGRAAADESSTMSAARPYGAGRGGAKTRKKKTENRNPAGLTSDHKIFTTDDRQPGGVFFSFWRSRSVVRSERRKVRVSNELRDERRRRRRIRRRRLPLRSLRGFAIHWRTAVPVSARLMLRPERGTVSRFCAPVRATPPHHHHHWTPKNPPRRTSSAGTGEGSPAPRPKGAMR